MGSTRRVLEAEAAKRAARMRELEELRGVMTMEIDAAAMESSAELLTIGVHN